MPRPRLPPRLGELLAKLLHHAARAARKGQIRRAWRYLDRVDDLADVIAEERRHHRPPSDPRGKP